MNLSLSDLQIIQQFSFFNFGFFSYISQARHFISNTPVIRHGHEYSPSHNHCTHKTSKIINIRKSHTFSISDFSSINLAALLPASFRTGVNAIDNTTTIMSSLLSSSGSTPSLLTRSHIFLLLKSIVIFSPKEYQCIRVNDYLPIC